MLDYHADLFMNMHEVPSCPTRGVLEVDDSGVWHNRMTNTKPLVLHFNGGSKDAMLDVEHGLWYYRRPLQPAPHLPRPLSADEVSETLLTIGPVPGRRDTDGAVRYDHTGCGNVEDFPPHSRFLAKWGGQKTPSLPKDAADQKRPAKRPPARPQRRKGRLTKK